MPVSNGRDRPARQGRIEPVKRLPAPREPEPAHGRAKSDQRRQHCQDSERPRHFQQQDLVCAKQQGGTCKEQHGPERPERACNAFGKKADQGQDQRPPEPLPDLRRKFVLTDHWSRFLLGPGLAYPLSHAGMISRLIISSNAGRGLTTAYRLSLTSTSGTRGLELYSDAITAP